MTEGKRMGNKTQLITPFLMLTAGTIASIIMYVRGFDLNTMLWDLLIVLIIFYIIGDIARYLYASVRPRVIPRANINQELVEALMNGENVTGNVVAVADGEGTQAGEAFSGEFSADGLMSEEHAYDSDEEGYSEEELGGYDEEENTDSYDSEEENTDKN